MFGFLKKLFCGSSHDAATGPATPSPVKSAMAPAAASTTGATTYVVVGAGPAGITAAETLREYDPNGKVVVLSGEAETPYSRMAIPYVLTGLIDETGTHLRKTDGHYQSRGISVVQAQVTAIDCANRTLSLSNGASQSYDKLLIATGASPVSPPIPGLDLPGVQHCWTLDDTRAIAERATEGSNVVLMGAGFIGCIIMEALLERGVNLTVIEALDRMVPRMMNETAGNLIKAWCENKGIAVHTSTKVTGISDNGGKLQVDMDKGGSVAADLVVVATGVRSNTGFLEGSGITLGNGIAVNEYLQTSDPNVYAAGDCAEGLDFSTGGASVHAIQPTATDHGRIAAANMTGQHAPYQGSLNMNVLDTAGLISASMGAWKGVEGGDTAEVLDAERFRYMRLTFSGNQLVGALSLGRTEHIGCLRGLIQSGRDLGVWKEQLMKDPNRIAEAYVAGSQ